MKPDVPKHDPARAVTARKRLTPRKLLVATLGAATVNYAIGCGVEEHTSTSGNLMAPPPGTFVDAPAPPGGGAGTPAPANPEPAKPGMLPPPDAGPATDDSGRDWEDGGSTGSARE
jgi:hypothetical protein